MARNTKTGQVCFSASGQTGDIDRFVPRHLVYLLIVMNFQQIIYHLTQAQRYCPDDCFLNLVDRGQTNIGAGDTAFLQKLSLVL